MNYPAFLQEDVYYNDLYDRQTVEECRRVVKRFVETAVSPPVEQTWLKLLVETALYFVRGECYARKFDTIAMWREKDRQRDRQLAQARPPSGIRCLACLAGMNCDEKDLHDRDGSDQALFYFICPKCDARRAFYEDGAEYRRKKVFCTQCQGETKTEYQHAGKIINVVTTCPNCGRVETEPLTIEQSAAPDENYAADRERFCMSEEEGREYASCQVNSEIFRREQAEQELRQKRQDLFTEIAKLKKLTVVDLENLLLPALEREGFFRLDLGKPAIKRDVQMSFCAQDCKPGRCERDSIKDLENAIEDSLAGTNWRLMSTGINYRLGVLNGCLRGLETEKNLLALVRMRLKKRVG